MYAMAKNVAICCVSLGRRWSPLLENSAELVDAVRRWWRGLGRSATFWVSDIAVYLVACVLGVRMLAALFPR